MTVDYGTRCAASNQLLASLRLLCLVVAGSLATAAIAAAQTLDIYFIDVEGGEATLIVTPSREAMLVDTGWDGFNNRDPERSLQFGRFTFVDLGDLPGANLSSLACPTNRIGHTDVYLVPHHGNADTAIPAVISAISPRVAILNFGVTKGGNAAGFDALRTAMSIEDVWQLHRTRNEGAVNFPELFIANLDEGEKDVGAWLKVSAAEDGSFTVTNGRTGFTKSYR